MSRLVADTMRMPVQPNKAIVGANAFSHSSGIHQDGFLKDALTYEIINPDEVGADGSKIVLTARVAAVHWHTVSRKSDMISHETKSMSCIPNFLQLADTKKEVGKKIYISWQKLQ